MYQGKTDGWFIGETREKLLRRDPEARGVLQTEQSQTLPLFSQEQAPAPPLNPCGNRASISYTHSWTWLTLWLFGHFLGVNNGSSNHRNASLCFSFFITLGFCSSSLLCYLFVRQY